MKESINKISEFLARRDIESLNKRSLKEKFNIEKVDVLVLLGSSITYSIKCAVEAYENGICNKIMICGGIGHSTEILRDVLRSHNVYKNIELNNNSEADIIFQIINKYYKVPLEKIIIENKSTNCGDNAKKAIEMLDNMGIKYNSLLLMQDPTMQLRTYLAFLKYLKDKGEIKVINYAPFIPKVNENIKLINKNIDGIWREERFIDLLMGEIPRLRDDETGYGPKGLNFIEHIDISDLIEESYINLKNIFGERCR